MQAEAAQDLGCLESAKFFYTFSEPVAVALAAAFLDCEVAHKAFSRFSLTAKDLLTIRKADEFRADLVIGGRRAVVYFEGPASAPPRHLIRRFETRLREAGCTTIHHGAPQRPNCLRCPEIHLKCRRKASRDFA